MAGRGCADVVFCLDTSASMRPCFDAVRQHLLDFLNGLRASGQMAWNLRFDFVAHRASSSGTGTHFQHSSLRYSELWDGLYGKGRQSSELLFTTDAEEFKVGITSLKAKGDEANFVALDFCLDMPWRESLDCHRVVIQLTDEPLETGLLVHEQEEKIPALIEKIQNLGVLLFLVGPESKAFDAIAQADRSEYEAVASSGDGLSRVDFARVLEHVGKSVSVSRLQKPRPTSVHRGLFGQENWGTSDTEFVGD